MIFVDRNTPCMPNASWRWNTVSHMWTDGDLEELHEFATSLGLRRSWFQKCDRPGLAPNRKSHYDLTPRVRKLALKAGAKEASREDQMRWLGREDLIKEGSDVRRTEGQAGEAQLF
jgi:hypothetical protein